MSMATSSPSSLLLFLLLLLLLLVPCGSTSFTCCPSNCAASCVERSIAPCRMCYAGGGPLKAVYRVNVVWPAICSVVASTEEAAALEATALHWALVAAPVTRGRWEPHLSGVVAPTPDLGGAVAGTLLRPSSSSSCAKEPLPNSVRAKSSRTRVRYQTRSPKA